MIEKCQVKEASMNSAARITKKPTADMPLSPIVTDLPVRRFTIDEYHKLLEVGILKNCDPYELLNGVITPKMPQNSPHSSAATRLERRLARLLPDAWLSRSQKPITIPGRASEPEPDVAIVCGPEETYDGRHPLPNEVALVCEVSESSIDNDASEKFRIYAGAKIPEYWIVNLVDRRVEVYTEPRGGKKPKYRQQTDYGPDEEVPFVLNGKEVGRIGVKELLPRIEGT
jgi:Uma2 family endonuclease